MIDLSNLVEGIRIVRPQERLGAAKARNAGADVSRSDYVAFLDDDDLWDTNYLSEIAKAIRYHSDGGREPDVLCGRLVRDDGSDAQSPRRLFREFRAALWANPGVTGSNLVVRRGFFEAIGGFDPSLEPSEDRDFVVRSLDAEALIVRVPAAISRIRNVSDERISSRFVRSNLKMIYRHRGKTSGREKALALTLIFYQLIRPIYKRLFPPD